MTEHADKRVIKKYANRRLYDTQTSKHITAKGIRQLIVDGNEVVIVEDTTDRDITKQLLLQIIAEQEQGGRPILDTAVLQGIIRYYGHPMQEMMSHYLTRSMETYLAQQQSIQQQMASLLEPESANEALQQMAKTNLEAWQAMQTSVFGAMYPGTSKNDDDAA